MLQHLNITSPIVICAAPLEHSSILGRFTALIFEEMKLMNTDDQETMNTDLVISLAKSNYFLQRELTRFEIESIKEKVESKVEDLDSLLVFNIKKDFDENKLFKSNVERLAIGLGPHVRVQISASFFLHDARCLPELTDLVHRGDNTNQEHRGVPNQALHWYLKFLNLNDQVFEVEPTKQDQTQALITAHKMLKRVEEIDDDIADYIKRQTKIAQKYPNYKVKSPFKNDRILSEIEEVGRWFQDKEISLT